LTLAALALVAAAGCRTTSDGSADASDVLTSPPVAPVAPPAPAGREYYMTLIGYERNAFDKFDTNAHTFASFAAFDRGGPTTVTRANEFTISWLPRDNGGKVTVTRLVPGHNWTFDETVRMALTTGRSIHRWGPFRITEELYDLAVAQKKRLDDNALVGGKNFDPIGSMNVIAGGLTASPGLYYVAVDPKCRNGAVQPSVQGCTNCFHAVSDMLVPFVRKDFMVNGGDSGFEATEETLQYFLQTPGKSFIMNYPRNRDEVALYSLESSQMAQAWSASVKLADIQHHGLQLNPPPGYVPQYRVKPSDIGGEGWVEVLLNYEMRRDAQNQIVFVDPLGKGVTHKINAVKVVVPAACSDAKSQVFVISPASLVAGAGAVLMPPKTSGRVGNVATFNFEVGDDLGIVIIPTWSGGLFKGKCSGFQIFRQ
jgi:hypothetical protein